MGANAHAGQPGVSSAASLKMVRGFSGCSDPRAAEEFQLRNIVGARHREYAECRASLLPGIY